MDIKFNVPPRTITKPTPLFYKVGEDVSFPVVCIGKDSYIWNAKINSGIEFTISKGFAIHNLQFGKFVSGAAGSEFCMGINHNYLNLAMGVSDLFNTNSEIDFEYKYKQRGQILIQNDVWLGHNVTVMPGVTIHNGAVVAANSHVVKDVPPYAIVGGNPSKLIKYRFSKEIIDKLLTIQWWNWSDKKIQNNNQFFINEEFAETNQELIDTFKKYIDEVLIYDDAKCSINVCIDTKENERAIFKSTDYFIANRSENTILHSCYADENNVKIMSGVDLPIF